MATAETFYPLFGEKDIELKNVWRAFYALLSPTDTCGVNKGVEFNSGGSTPLKFQIKENGDLYVNGTQSLRRAIASAMLGGWIEGFPTKMLPLIMQHLLTTTWPRKDSNTAVGDVSLDDIKAFVSPPTADLQTFRKMQASDDMSMYVLFVFFVKYVWNRRAKDESRKCDMLLSASRQHGMTVAIGAPKCVAVESSTRVEDTADPEYLTVSIAQTTDHAWSTVNRIVVRVRPATRMSYSFEDFEFAAVSGEPSQFRNAVLWQQAFSVVLAEVTNTNIILNPAASTDVTTRLDSLTKTVATQMDKFADFCAEQANREWRFKDITKNAAHFYTQKVMSLQHGTDTSSAMEMEDLRRIRLGAVDEWLKELERDEHSRDPRACIKPNTNTEITFSYNLNPGLLRAVEHRMRQVVEKIQSDTAYRVLMDFLLSLLKYINEGASSTKDRPAPILQVCRSLIHALPAYLTDTKENGGCSMKHDFADVHVDDSTPLFPLGATMKQMNEKFFDLQQAEKARQLKVKFEDESKAAQAARDKSLKAVKAINDQIKEQQAKLDDLLASVAKHSNIVAELTAKTQEVAALKAEKNVLKQESGVLTTTIERLQREETRIEDLIMQYETEGQTVANLEMKIQAVQEDIKRKQEALEAQQHIEGSIDASLAEITKGLQTISRDNLKISMEALINGVSKFISDEKILTALSFTEDEIASINQLKGRVQKPTFVESVVTWFFGLRGLSDATAEKNFHDDLGELISIAHQISTRVQALGTLQYDIILQNLNNTQSAIERFKDKREELLAVLKLELPHDPKANLQPLLDARAVLAVPYHGGNHYDAEIDDKVLKDIAAALDLQQKALTRLDMAMEELSSESRENVIENYNGIFAALQDLDVTLFNRLGGLLEEDAYKRLPDCQSESDEALRRKCAFDRTILIDSNMHKWKDLAPKKIKEWQITLEKLKEEVNITKDQITNQKDLVEKTGKQREQLASHLKSLEEAVAKDEKETKNLRELEKKYNVDTVTKDAQAALLRFRDNVINKLPAEKKASLPQNLLESLEKVKDGDALTNNDFTAYGTLADKVKELTSTTTSEIDRWTKEMQKLQEQLDTWTAKKKEYSEINAALRVAKTEAVTEEMKVNANKVASSITQQPPLQMMPQQGWQGGYGGMMRGGYQPMQYPAMGNPYAAARAQQLQRLRGGGGWAAGGRRPTMAFPQPPPASVKEWRRLRKNDLGFNPY